MSFSKPQAGHGCCSSPGLRPHARLSLQVTFEAATISGGLGPILCPDGSGAFSCQNLGCPLAHTVIIDRQKLDRLIRTTHTSGCNVPAAAELTAAGLNCSKKGLRRSWSSTSLGRHSSHSHTPQSRSNSSSRLFFSLYFFPVFALFISLCLGSPPAVFAKHSTNNASRFYQNLLSPNS